MAALELNDKVDKGRYFHGKGCSHCNGMGYRGRTGVYELLEMTRGGGCRQRSDPSHFLKVARRRWAAKRCAGTRWRW
jgi:MSHA biogenesis protein MshE